MTPFGMSTVIQTDQTFAYFRPERLRIPVQTRSYSMLSILLVTNVIMTTDAIAVIAEFTVRKTFAIPVE